MRRFRDPFPIAEGRCSLKDDRMKPASACWLGRCGTAAYPAVVLLAGCAQYLAAYESTIQWREGRVVQIDRGASIDRPSQNDCRKKVAPSVAANERYAAYQYIGVGGSLRYRIAPLPLDMPLKVGDLVWVNIEDCSLPPAAR
jgi:hypothetical protein